MTLAELRAELLTDLYPQKLSENLMPRFNQRVVEALIYLQRYVKSPTGISCLQENNTQVYPFCSTYWACNMTVVGAPNGVIKRLYTIGPGGHCDRVFYQQVDYDTLVCGASSIGLKQAPDNEGMPVLQAPLKYSGPETDRACGRSRYGFYAIHNGRIHVAPSLHSSESIVAEWDGLKREWADADMVSDEPDFRRAVMLFVSREMQRTVQKDIQMSAAEGVTFNDALQDLIHDCTLKTRVNESSICAGRENEIQIAGGPNAAAEVAVDDSIIFAQIGSYGDISSTAFTDVAALVATFGPRFILAAGNNYYGAEGTFAGFDAAAGQPYHSFINPYLGTYGDGAGQNKFWPAIGPFDRDPPANLPIYQTFFPSLPGNGLFYDFIVGPIHVFVLDTGYDKSFVNRQGDFGVESTSQQAEWLRVKMSVSRAKWKVVVMHHPPYSSAATVFNLPPLAGDGTYSFPPLRWNFKAWGADVVISGGPVIYERLTVDGLTYIVNGLGGKATADDFTTPAPQSQARYNEDFGAMKWTVTCDLLKGEFINREGDVIDTIELE